MAESSATLHAPPNQEGEASEALKFTLHVISAGSEPPLSFAHLPATTTVGQLKAKIRDALPSKPDHQRLIYRGRLISKDTDTMLDVFGQEVLASPEPKNLHLVLPPPAASAPVPGPTLLNNAIPQALGANIPPRPQSTPSNLAQGMHTQQQLPGTQHVHHQILQNQDGNIQAVRFHQMQQDTQRLYRDIAQLEQRMRAFLQQPSFPTAQQPTPINSDIHTVEQLEQRMRALGQSATLNAQPLIAGNPGGVLYGLPQRQAPMPPLPVGLPSFQNLIYQNQRERAAQGLHGPQDIPGIAPSLSAPGSGRASPIINRPDGTTTYTREGVGPSGQRWQMTVNETTTTHVQAAHSNPQHHHIPNPLIPQPGLPLPQMNPHPHGLMHPHQHHVQEIQAILRNANRLNHAQQNAQGSSSNLPSATVPPSAPTSSTPGGQQSGIPVTTTPLNSNTSTTQIPSNNTAHPAVAVSNQQALGQPTAYILSSPSGPQALLVSSAGVFWTPRPSRPSSRRHSPTPGPVGGQDPAAAAGFPEFRNRPAHRAGRRHGQQENAPEPLNAPIANPHANPVAAGGLAQFGPMLWLLIRLAGFVWFFTSGNTSWTRLFVISGLALMLFIANTGVFNGVAEQAWGPIRRHLEALIPLAGPDAALVPAANAAVVPQAAPPAWETDQANPGLRRRRRAAEPDPAEAAARILAQRRQNQGWLSLQIRRVEHAALLFLASLVPGVGERHIAAREAEATAAEAERQRQIDAANAEEAAANGEGEAAEGGNNDASSTGENVTGNTENAPPIAPPAEV